MDAQRLRECPRLGLRQFPLSGDGEQLRQLVRAAGRVEPEFWWAPRTVRVFSLGHERHESFSGDLGRRIVLASSFREPIALLNLAETESRVLLTLDKDFWQIAIQRRKPLERSGVILFRVHPAIPGNITPLVLRTLSSGQEWGGHASVVTPERVLMVLLRAHETH